MRIGNSDSKSSWQEIERDFVPQKSDLPKPGPSVVFSSPLTLEQKKYIRQHASDFNRKVTDVVQTLLKGQKRGYS